MAVDGVTDHLSDELVNQDDADVVTCQEAPGGKKINKKKDMKHTKLHSDFYQFNTRILEMTIFYELIGAEDPRGGLHVISNQTLADD